MKINEFENILKNAKSIELIRRGNFMLTLPFFYYAFEEDNAAISEEKLLVQLEYFLSHQTQIEENDTTEQSLDTFESKAKKYITEWTDQGYLNNYENDEGDIFYELSSYASKTINWIISLDKEEFVGTESKFLNILRAIEELVENTNEDREERIKILEGKKKEIDDEINQLKSGRNIRVFDRHEIASRYRTLVLRAKELVSDFKEVEINFKSITKDLQKHYLTNHESKHDILEYSFDAIYALKDTPQGKSFYAFWALLMDKSSQMDWEIMIDNLYNALNSRNIESKDDFIKDMKNHLYKSGQKVHGANNKMAEKLSNIITENFNEQVVSTRQTFQEIKKLIIEKKDILELSALGIDYEEAGTAKLLMEHQLKLDVSERKHEIHLEESNNDIIDAESFEILMRQIVIDKEKIRNKFDKKLSSKSQFTLKEIFDEQEITKGLAEIFGYLQVAKEYNHTYIENDKFLVCFDKENQKYLNIPSLIVS